MKPHLLHSNPRSFKCSFKTEKRSKEERVEFRNALSRWSIVERRKKPRHFSRGRDLTHARDQEYNHTFLDAFSHLYKRVCPSVRRSVRPSVRPFVRPSVTHEFKPCISAVFDQNYYQYQRERILWPCIRPCSINKFILQMHIMTFCKFYHQFFTDPSCDFMPTHIQLGIWKKKVRVGDWGWVTTDFTGILFTCEYPPLFITLSLPDVVHSTVYSLSFESCWNKRTGFYLCVYIWLWLDNFKSSLLLVVPVLWVIEHKKCHFAFPLEMCAFATTVFERGYLG